MVAIVLIGGVFLGALIAVYSPYRVCAAWRAPYMILQVIFGVLIVLGAWIHTGVWAQLSFAGLFATGAMLYVVYRFGRAKLKN